MIRQPLPGISREQRITDEGIIRLKKQLDSGAKMNPRILAQWIKRYGDPVREVIKQRGFYCPELDRLDEQ